ncbi:alpha/beta hydrolase [Nocardia pseudovaccinii]|uniref:alpha/beta hydrolase n=1 Tax=Nocardia pseudovaccinii TaxID=189540 RepID=UPI000A8F6B0D|nr:alpha/beta hydrolase [Nocardia pseudovaccinii]
MMDNYIFELDENVTRTPVSYKNRYGITLAADLYRPKEFDENRQYPALVIGPPYSGVKEQGPGIYAQQMAKRGFVALAFDPSYNGYSGGEPRHSSSPDIFVEDFSAGVDFLGTRPFIDRERIGGIGLCGSGGFVLSAAQVDRRIKAVVTSALVDISKLAAYGPTGDLTGEARAAMLDALAEQRYADFLNPVPVLGPRGAAIGFDDDTEPVWREFGTFYSTPRGYHPNSITQFTATSDLAFANFALLSHLDWISPRPILLIAGEQAFSRRVSEDVYQAASEPKELLLVPAANHVDLYDRTDLIPFDKVEQFFTKHLA